MTPGPDEEEIEAMEAKMTYEPEEVVFDFTNPTARQMADFFASLPPDTRFRVVDLDSGWIIDIFEIVVDQDNVAWLEPRSPLQSGFSDEKIDEFERNQGPT